MISFYKELTYKPIRTHEYTIEKWVKEKNKHQKMKYE